jgi:DNA/RNA-binding domain of Phe-tRNA-synthetase-like protein
MDHRISETTPQSPTLTQSPELAQIPMLWKVYRNLRIKKRDPKVEKWVKENVARVRERCGGPGCWDTAILRGYVSLHDRHTDEKNIPSSCEVLMRLVLERGSVPRINTFVDVYNVVSILTEVSIGAHDTDHLVGDPRLEILETDVFFEPIGGRGEGLAKRGEYAYMDEKGVLCRMDIKQCDRTKITEQTKSVLVIFQGHGGAGEDLLRESIRLLEEALRRFEVMA